MRGLDINGVHVTVASKAEVEELEQKIQLVELVPGSLFAWMWPSRENLVVLALGSTSNIDFAVPQDWWDHFDQSHRRVNGDWAVWDYRGPGVFGEPLWNDTIERLAKDRILAALAEWPSTVVANCADPEDEDAEDG